MSAPLSEQQIPAMTPEFEVALRALVGIHAEGESALYRNYLKVVLSEVDRLREERHSTNETRPERELGAEWAERLTAMRARVEAATSGTWHVRPGDPDTLIAIRGEHEIVVASLDASTAGRGAYRADREFIVHAHRDMPALLDLLDQALRILRQHQDWHARDAMRIKALEADASAHVPELRKSVRGWSERCLAAEANAEALRVRNVELEARAGAPATWFLADSEGAEGGPTLHATLDAAKAWADGVEAAEWVEEDGVWVQVHCDQDTDRPTHRGAGTVTPLTLAGGAS